MKRRSACKFVVSEIVAKIIKKNWVNVNKVQKEKSKKGEIKKKFAKKIMKIKLALN